MCFIETGDLQLVARPKRRAGSEIEFLEVRAAVAGRGQTEPFKSIRHVLCGQALSLGAGHATCHTLRRQRHDMHPSILRSDLRFRRRWDIVR